MAIRRFEDDINGAADAKGNVTLIWKGMTGQFASLLLIAQAQGGSPSWTVKVTGAPVNVGRGVNSPLRLPLLHPGDGVILVGSGIQPSTAVTGHFVGYAADSPNELPLAPPEPSTIALDTSLQQSVLAVITTVGGGDNVSRSIPLPAGSQAVGYMVTFTGFGNPATIVVTGDQTSKSYFATGVVSGAPLDFQAVPLAAADTSVTVSVTSQAQPDKVTFLVWGYNPTSFVQQQASTSFDVKILDVVAQTRASVVAGATRNELAVAMPDPALWQAPNQCLVIHSSPPATTAWAALITGVAGQLIYLHDWELVGPSAANSVYLSTSNVNGGVGVNPGIFAELRMDGGAAPGPERSKRFGGFRVGGGGGTLGATVYWACDSSPNSVFGSLTYSQG